MLSFRSGQPSILFGPGSQPGSKKCAAMKANDKPRRKVICRRATCVKPPRGKICRREGAKDGRSASGFANQRHKGARGPRGAARNTVYVARISRRHAEIAAEDDRPHAHSRSAEYPRKRRGGKSTRPGTGAGTPAPLLVLCRCRQALMGSRTRMNPRSRGPRRLIVCERERQGWAMRPATKS